MTSTLWRWLGAASLALAATPAFAQPFGGPFGFGWGWGWGFGHGIAAILFWVFIVMLIVWVARGFGGPRMALRSNYGALQILQERFARGEIDKQEYEDRRRTLVGG